jgi:hypothetical protein
MRQRSRRCARYARYDIKKHDDVRYIIARIDLSYFVWVTLVLQFLLHITGLLTAIQRYFVSAQMAWRLLTQMNSGLYSIGRTILSMHCQSFSHI